MKLRQINGALLLMFVLKSLRVNSSRASFFARATVQLLGERTPGWRPIRGSILLFPAALLIKNYDDKGGPIPKYPKAQLP